MTDQDNNTVPIFTVGYGKRTMEQVVQLLQRYDIRFIVDFRSSPYSTFKPEFSKDALDTALSASGIRYVFMGDLLGGRPDDPSCYADDGKVSYDSIKTKGFYQTGISRLQTAFAKQQTIALLCSEGRPEDCHRSKLIGVSLSEIKIPVFHIDDEGNLKSQEHVMEIVTPQPSLFEDFVSLTSRKKYSPSAGSKQPGETSEQDDELSAD